MGITKQKTFSATSLASLDLAVNAFIGRQTVDGRTLERIPKFLEFTFVAPNFYVLIIYEENPFSSN